MKRNMAIGFLFGLLVVAALETSFLTKECLATAQKKKITLPTIEYTVEDKTPGGTSKTKACPNPSPCYIADTYGNIGIQDVSNANKAQISWTDGGGTAPTLVIQNVKLKKMKAVPAGSITVTLVFNDGLPGVHPMIFVTCKRGSQHDAFITVTGTVSVPNPSKPDTTIANILVGKMDTTVFKCAPYSQGSSTLINGGAKLKIQIDFSSDGDAILTDNKLELTD